MLASIYLHGHLVAATFSLAMALAFAVSMARVPGARADLWYVVTFLLTASCALAEMWVAYRPTLAPARAQLCLEAILLFFITPAFHAQYAHEVFSAHGLRRHRRAVIAYALLTMVVVALIVSGVADGNRIHPLHRWGVHSAAVYLTMPAFALFALFVLANAAIQAPILLADGPRRSERRWVALPVLATPLCAVHELGIGIGVVGTLPVGGYFAATAGIIGAFVLAERFRSLVRAGSVVGAYTLERRLGGGGMADVYLARRGGRPGGVVQRVALKRLRTEFVEDPTFVRMLLDEARLVARLQHPHIVTLLDVGEHRGELFLAMELVEGAPLSRMLQLARRRQRVVDDAAVIEVGVQVADALVYAHAMCDDAGRTLQLVHRDVSPQNILVDKVGHVKLADFGIARSLERDGGTRTGVMKGKLSYMAPEQVSTSTYDQRIDVYALGVVLFEMLSNRVPYKGSTEPTILRRLLDNDPEPYRRAAGLAPPLGPLVREATHPDPCARLATAAALHAALLPLRDEARGRAALSALVADCVAVDEPADLHEAPTVAES